MSKNFWNWFGFFFFYIFPLTFSYVGEYKSEPLLATLSLAAGILGWIWLIVLQYNQLYAKQKDMQRWLFLFSLGYAIVVFAGNHFLYSDGNGWRWLSFWHPWVWTPFVLLFFYIKKD